jgi:nucleoside phosphorylase
MELQNTLLELLDNWQNSLTIDSMVDAVNYFLQTMRMDEELQEHFGLCDEDLDKIKITTQPKSSVQSALDPSSSTSKSRSDTKIQPSGILIVTVTQVEAQAVLEVFSQAANKPWSRQVIGSKTYYSLGIHGGVPIFMVQSEMGTATPGGALLTVSQAIQQLHPQAIIMCGIAFGLRQDRQQLGDILIAKQLQYYEPQKVDLQLGQIPRGDRVAVSDRLLDRFRSGVYDWKGAHPHFGLVLSGEKLVNDPAFRDWLLNVEPEAVGGDMEGAGLYVAARDAKVDWILVKAICDWADGSKNDYSQRMAADNAVQFTLHVLRIGGWTEPD